MVATERETKEWPFINRAELKRVVEATTSRKMTATIVVIKDIMPRIVLN